jgi:hypothetical protein
VRDALPDARQVVLDQCGHVPQVEHPVDANALVHDFIGHVQGSAAQRAAARIGRAVTRIHTRLNGNGLNGNGRAKPDETLGAAEADAA